MSQAGCRLAAASLTTTWPWPPRDWTSRCGGRAVWEQYSVVAVWCGDSTVWGVISLASYLTLRPGHGFAQLQLPPELSKVRLPHTAPPPRTVPPPTLPPPYCPQVGRCLFIVENALAVVAMHFLRYLPRPFPSAVPPTSDVSGTTTDATNRLLEAAAASLDMYDLAPPGEADAAKLGSPADIAFFMSKLQVCGGGASGVFWGGAECVRGGAATR